MCTSTQLHMLEQIVHLSQIHPSMPPHLCAPAQAFCSDPHTQHTLGLASCHPPVVLQLSDTCANLRQLYNPAAYLKYSYRECDTVGFI